MNQINVIAPYKLHGMWVFDDPRVGLSQEPFIAGADTMIDHMVAEIPHPETGFLLVFSEDPFPGAQYKFEHRREEGSGNVYYSPRFGMEGWLCPALLRYFRHAPKQLYVEVRPRT